MLKIIKENKDVKVVFKPVGFLSPTSQTSAKAMLAAAKKGKFIELYEGLITFNGRITDEVIDEQIKKAGLDLNEIKKLMNSEEINKNFEEIARLSNKVEVRGVPTLIINGEPLRAIDFDPIQNAINNLR
jgi:protein-disulfide isomerase